MRLTVAAVSACAGLVLATALTPSAAHARGPVTRADVMVRPLDHGATVRPVRVPAVAARTRRGDVPHVLTTKFNGLSACTCQSTNASVAAGTTQVLQVAADQMGVFSRSGVLQSQRSLLTMFDADAVTGSYATYDAVYRQWLIVAALAKDNAVPEIGVYVTTGSDVTGEGYAYQFPLPAGVGADGTAVYPLIGSDQDAVAITSDNYTSLDYDDSTVFTLAKAQLFNIESVTRSAFFPVPYRTAPAIVADQSNRMFLLAADADSDAMHVLYLTDTSKTPSTKLHVKGDSAYSWDAPSRPINQPDGEPLGYVSGIRSPVSQLDGKLWFAHAASLPDGSDEFYTVNWGYVNSATLALHVSHAYHSGSSDDFAPAIVAVRPPFRNVPTEILTWAYTDVATNTSVTTAYAVNTGYAIHPLTGVAYSANGGDANSLAAGSISSVASDPTSDATCASAQYAWISGQYYSSTGTLKTRIARVGPNC